MGGEWGGRGRRQGRGGEGAAESRGLTEGPETARGSAGPPAGNGEQCFLNHHKQPETKLLLCFFSVDIATDELRKDSR